MLKRMGEDNNIPIIDKLARRGREFNKMDKERQIDF